MTEASQRIPTSIKLEREERLEQFRDEMEDVWVEYQHTGMHTTGEEVFAWIDSWFSEDEKPIPNAIVKLLTTELKDARHCPQLTKNQKPTSPF